MVFVQQKYIDNNMSQQVLDLNISKIPLQGPFKLAINFQTKFEKKIKNISQTCVFCELYSFYLLK